MDNSQDNAIEWITNQKMVCVSFSQKKYVNKIMRYLKSHPDEVELVAENKDGSVCAHIPISWVKISPPRKSRELNDEEKAKAAERLKNARAKKNQATDKG